MPTEVKFRKKEFNLSEDSTSGVIVFDTTSKSIYVGGDRFSRPETITQLKKYTSECHIPVNIAQRYLVSSNRNSPWQIPFRIEQNYHR